MLCGLTLAYPSAAYAALSSLLQHIRQWSSMHVKYIPVPNPLDPGMILYVILEDETVSETTRHSIHSASAPGMLGNGVSVTMSETKWTIHTHVKVTRHSEDGLRGKGRQHFVVR